MGVGADRGRPPPRGPDAAVPQARPVRRRRRAGTPRPVTGDGPIPIFDAHTHLDAMAQRAGLEATDAFVADAMRAAREVGVLAAITVGDTVASSRWCVAAAAAHPDVYAAVAVHP